jgi:membrane-anchored glycerophosphoryl diester phosphodiesterase (GDPDase)
VTLEGSVSRPDDRPGSQLSFVSAVALALRTCVGNLRACILLTATVAVLSGVGNAVWRSASLITDERSVSSDEVRLLFFAVVAALAVFALVYIFVIPVTVGALSLLGSAAVYGDEVDLRGIVRQTFDRALESVGAFLVTILILLAAPVVIGLFALAVAYGLEPEEGFGVLIFALSVVTLPGFYVFVRLSLAVPVVMREDVGPIDALRRSWGLVRGKWWWVFTVGFLIPLGFGVVTRLLSVGSIFGPDSTADFLIGAVVSAVGLAVTVSIYGVASGIVYASLAPEDTSAEARRAAASDQIL